MARPPKPQNAQNPLRQLRALIAAPGRPLTQQQLSAIIDVPVDTIKSIEAGRRSLQKAVRQKIWEATSALWNDKRGHWTNRMARENPYANQWTGNSKRAFDFESYSNYRRYVDNVPVDKGREVEILKHKVEALLNAVPDWRLQRLLLRLNSYMEECRVAFDLKRLKGAFRMLQPVRLIARDAEGNVIGASRYYPGEYPFANTRRLAPEKKNG